MFISTGSNRGQVRSIVLPCSILLQDIIGMKCMAASTHSIWYASTAELRMCVEGNMLIHVQWRLHGVVLS
jgi:hypothetical protein